MNSRERFTKQSLPDIQTGFVLRDGGISIFNELVFDFDSDRRDLDLSLGPENLLDIYSQFIPCKFKEANETWYIAPKGIDYISLYLDNPDNPADVTIRFHADKDKYAFQLETLPKQLINHPDFIRLDVVPVAIAHSPYFQGNYIFNNGYLASLLENQEWAKHYVFGKPNHQRELLDQLRETNPATKSRSIY